MFIYRILIVLLAVLVTFLIRIELTGKRKHSYWLKPLSTLIIIGIAFFPLLGVHRVHLGYSCLIILGLLFSLGGDVALMFRSDSTFRIGLVFFLMTHIVYAVTFSIFNGFIMCHATSTLSLIVLALLMYWYLFPGLKNLKIPVLLYILIISFMMNQAIGTQFAYFFNTKQATFITTGAALFYISDVILAVNRFRKPFRLNRISLAFYYSGQLLIALSTAYF